MTIIVALKDEKNKRVILGTDKQATCGQLISKTQDKILSLPINIVDGYGDRVEQAKLHIGLCGYLFMNSFLKHGFNIPDMTTKQNFTEYLYQSFFPSLTHKLDENKLVETDCGKLNTRCGMLFIFKGEVYLIGSNFCVDIVDDEYFVDGSGHEVAVGSLYTNLHFHNKLNRVEMVKQAIKTAGATTIYCDTDVNLKVINY